MMDVSNAQMDISLQDRHLISHINVRNVHLLLIIVKLAQTKRPVLNVLMTISNFGMMENADVPEELELSSTNVLVDVHVQVAFTSRIKVVFHVMKLSEDAEDAIFKHVRHKFQWQIISCNPTGNIFSAYHAQTMNYLLQEGMEQMNKKTLMEVLN
jgi:hypothetical protein